MQGHKEEVTEKSCILEAAYTQDISKRTEIYFKRSSEKKLILTEKGVSAFLGKDSDVFP